MRRPWPLLGIVIWIVIPTLPPHLLAQRGTARAAPQAQAAAAPEAPAPAPVVIADEPQTIDPATVVPQALAKRATVTFTDTSLKDVVKWLQDDQKISVLLDTKALAEGRVLLSEPVTDKLNNEPIYLLLDRLRTIGVGWHMQRGVVHVTTLSAATEYKPTVPYILSDLRDAGFDAVQLVEAIRDGVGGPWTSDGDDEGGSLMLLGDVLFVMQTEAKHREVAGLLAALRKHGRRTYTLDNPQHAVLRTQLAQNVTVNFQEAPLVQAIADLAKLGKIDVRLDRVSLRSINVRDRSPVSLELADQPLSTALQGLLVSLNLTGMMRDGVLWVTSQADSERFLLTAVYDVRDLCRDEHDALALGEAIEGQTSARWIEGAAKDGTARPGGSISFPRPGVMVVRQTEAGHADVLQLLENYRLALKASKPRPTPGDDPKEILVRYYRLSSEIADAVVPVLPKLVAPDSWSAPERPDAKGEILHRFPAKPTLITAGGQEILAEGNEVAKAAVLVPNVVIAIQQSREVHGKIADLLDRVESGDPRRLPTAGGGGMGGGMGGFFSIPSRLMIPSRFISPPVE